MYRWVDLDDDRNCFCGDNGEYENWNIDPEAIKEGLEDGSIGLPSIYGYNSDYLITFAMACRKAGVENEDLKDFVSNCRLAYDMVRKDIEENLKIVINGTDVTMEGEM